MKMAFKIAAAAALLVLAQRPCFAMWDVETVAKGRAQELGMEVRSNAAGPDQIGVELEFKPEGELRNFGRVDLRVGEGNSAAVTAPLREDRSKPGTVLVRFTADRAQLDALKLWVMVPGTLGGSIYELRVKDFVESKKDK